ncbi:MAG: hypothetical protein K0S47_2144 [Herbinix sp.]|jgi:GNAT superfamily N-acetyltransferase|nr:hypothetical protein [Herbinix sp.]
MDQIKAIKLEEDMFPKTFTNCTETEYGVLFYNGQNKSSYDSNHALIYKDRVSDLNTVLTSITDFYLKMRINPNIYQAVEDEGYFKENEAIFHQHGYKVWIEGPDNFMVLSAENQINSKYQLDIKLITKWDERIASDICIPSEEEHEIDVIKASVSNPCYRVFVGYHGEKAVAITYFHLSDYDCCRFDYILISKEHREQGYARELLSYVTDYCREQQLKNCFQWPAHKTSEKICYEAGFRHLFYAEAGRASYQGS